MALLGRLIVLVQDTTGISSTGASVTILRQGAQIKGTQAGPTYTVDDPGGIVVGDVVFAASAPSTLRAVTAVTATTVTVGAPGLGTLSDDDRLVLSTSGNVTLYSDATGTDTLSNPLTTDASGVATAWVPGGFYDADFSGGTPSLTRAFQYDIYVAGYKTISDIYNSGTAVAFQTDTLRTLGAGDKLWSFANNTVEKASIDSTGKWSGTAGAFSGALTTTGITNTGTITSSSTISITAGGLGVTAGGITVTAGDIGAVASLINSKRYGGTGGTAIVAGDFVIGAGWGNTATISNITGTSDDTRGQIRVTANGAGLAANPTLVLTFKDGTYTSTPFVIACPGTNYTAFAASDYWHATASPTSATFILGGTAAPTAGRVYELNWWVIK